MRTVDPELWSKNFIKPKSIFASFTCKRRATLFEILLRSSLSDAMKEFWDNSFLGGRIYLHMNNSNKSTRYIFIFILVACFTCVAAITALFWKSALKTPPTTMSLLSSQHNLKHIDFPAVALCSYNLISRTALREYSAYLNKKDGNRTYSVAQIEQNLLRFGALLEMRGAKVDIHFTRFLWEVDGERNITNLMLKKFVAKTYTYVPRSRKDVLILRSLFKGGNHLCLVLLSPRCMGMLIRCTWSGNIVPCEQLFAVRLTPHGFCCAFNSRYQLEDINNPAKKVNYPGKRSGLGVAMRENSEDFAYLRQPVSGIEVLIWEGREYPEPGGGPMYALSARRNASVFIALKASVQHADRSLRYISENWRKCRLPDLGHGAFGQSYGWCLLECRERAVRALCFCTPHTLLALYSLYGRQPRTICSFDHLDCIDKYRDNFMYYKGNADITMPSGLEFEGDLECAHCLPDCAKTRYTVRLTHSSFNHVEKLYKNPLVDGIAFMNTTFMQVFFASHEQKEFLVETTLRWSVMCASLCSLWVLFAGSLLLVFFELVFHCTVRWRRSYVRRRETLAAHRRIWARLDPYCSPRGSIQPIGLRLPEYTYKQ